MTVFDVSCFVFQIIVRVDGEEVLKAPLPSLRALWEDTSFQLERLQANEICVKQEEEGLAKRTQPYFKLTFDPSDMPGISQLSKINQDQCLLYRFICGQGWKKILFTWLTMNRAAIICRIFFKIDVK